MELGPKEAFDLLIEAIKSGKMEADKIHPRLFLLAAEHVNYCRPEKYSFRNFARQHEDPWVTRLRESRDHCSFVTYR